MPPPIEPMSSQGGPSFLATFESAPPSTTTTDVDGPADEELVDELEAVTFERPPPHVVQTGGPAVQALYCVDSRAQNRRTRRIGCRIALEHHAHCDGQVSACAK